MPEGGPPATSIESVVETVGSGVTEAFALLADETRLAILLTLWEAYEPRSDAVLSFSELFDRVEYEDRGNFNYHLGELVGTFVTKVPEGGYQLAEPGLSVLQAVVGGIDADESAFGPSEIDQRCPLCGGVTAVGYQHRHVYWKCTACPGIVPDDEAIPGFLGAIKFDPAGVTGRSPDQIKAASRVAERYREGCFFDGLCPTCSGPVDARLDHCTDHGSDGICPHCRRRFSTRVAFRCRVCRDHSTTSLLHVAKLHPAVSAFFESRGVSTRYRADATPKGPHIETMVDNFDLEQVAADPVRVRVTASYDGDAVAVTFGEAGEVVEVSD